MIERSIAFGPGDALVGTLCLPDAGAAMRGIGAIALIAGVVHRVGPHRINVLLARRLAARGIPSLRFDLSGQGDSARIAGSAGHLESAIAEIRLAMDALGAATGVPRFALFGICSGGVHSFAVAQRDPRVAGAVLYDTYIYRTVKSRLNRYRLKFAAQHPLASAAQALKRAQSLLGLSNRQASGPARTGLFATPTPEEFARIARELHGRRSRLAMVYSGAFEDYNYAGQFHDRFREHGLEGLVTCDFLPEAGHTATRIADRVRLLDVVEGRIAGFDGDTPAP